MTIRELDAKLQLRYLLRPGLSGKDVFRTIRDIVGESIYCVFFENKENASNLYCHTVGVEDTLIKRYIYEYYRDNFPISVCVHFSFGYTPSEWWERDRINTILSLNNEALYSFMNNRVPAYRREVFPQEGKYSYLQFERFQYFESIRCAATTEQLNIARERLAAFFDLKPLTKETKQSREEWVAQKLQQLKTV